MEVSSNARAIWSRGRNLNTREFTVNTRHPPIHTLNNDELIHLFGLYLLDVRDEYDHDGGDEGIITPHWDRERLWYKLAQVCRRWRHLILESSNCLGLHLVCTYGIPVADMLAHSPPLPLIIIYLEKDREMTSEDEESILIALGPEYRDRVRRIGLWMPASSSPKLITAMEEPFPNLESMLIMPATESLILLISFQAPILRCLRLWGAALPLGSPSFDTFEDLVTLALSDIPQGAYFPPSDLVTSLSLMPRLERLMIGFRSHLPNRDVEQPLETMPTPLPNLRWIEFKGVSAYLEGLLVRIRTPLLSRLHIHFFFNRLIFTVPCLTQFMVTMQNFNFRSIRVAFLAGSVVLSTHPNGQDQLYPFTVTIRCNPVDWQVASMAQILKELQPVLSNSEQLTLSHGDSVSGSLSERHSEFDRTWWREFLGPFENLRTLHVPDELVWELSQTLQSNGSEPPTELLPNLKELGYSGGGDARDAFTPFLNQRQVAGRPVSLSTVRRSSPVSESTIAPTLFFPHNDHLTEYCDRCSRWFPHYRALEQHKEDSSYHWTCDDCDIDFASSNSREQHYVDSSNHYYCKACSRHFKSDESKRQHMRAKHWYYCGEHDEWFNSEASLWTHFEADHHACRSCFKLFNTHAGLQDHDRKVHIYCTDCQRSFQNQNSLRQHLSSNLHQLSTVLCPGRGCNRSFTSPASLVLHFESGTCPSGMTRDELNRLVVRADRNNVITNRARLLGGPSGYEPPTSVKVWATGRSWNGEAYECFLCNNTFMTLSGLNQHLQSPRHEEKIYRCPKSDCRIQFVALSALCQHVERGSCGVRKFRQVRDTMESLTRGFNAITI